MARMPQVLMIDDDLRQAGMTRDYLQGSGFEVALAGDAAQGLDALARGRCDVVILDLMLPDADGLDLCRRLRAARETADLPILMLTAKGDPLDRVVGLELGADDYLPKPFEPRELLARLRALLRRLLRNLLDNARRHGVLSPSKDEVDVVLRTAADGFELDVCDRGPGVSAAERERIFEPFYRLAGASETAGGVGLGLALVRKIAAQHGGSAVCLPRAGGGSCFRVRLPRG